LIIRLVHLKADMTKKILSTLLQRSIFGRQIPDEVYLKLLYRIKVGRRLDLENPKAFSEKIQWLKLNCRYDIMTQCSDKYEVWRFVEDRIGPEVLKELYGVYKKIEDIDINKLPDAFVLKVNHGSGQNIFCKKNRNWTGTIPAVC